MKEIMVAVVLMVATATPVFAQEYCACWGTGNVIDQSLLEKTNGAYGYAMSAPRRAVQQQVQQHLPTRAAT